MVKSNFSYEEIYAMKIMAFEKEQVRKRLRPPLPPRQGVTYSYSNNSPAAVAQRIEQKDTRETIYKGILSNISAGEAADLKTIANRIGTTPQKLQNYMKSLAEEGYLTRLTMENSKRSVVYVYLKTGKEIPES